MQHQALQAIRKSGFFKGLSPSSISRIASLSIRREFTRNETIFNENMHGEHIYLLHSGAIQLTKSAPNGSETVVRTIKPGEVFAEVILFEHSRYPVTSTAVINSVTFAFSKKDILELLNEKDFREDFIMSLMQKMRYLTERVGYLTSYDVEERFLMFIKEHYGTDETIDIDLPKKDIAAAIGSTPETFSRLVKRLQKEGKITWQGRELVLKSLD